jgi:DeoR family suf operon transcriptional repressor
MQNTRQGILEILKEQGEATVDELAERLELTSMTIRHHLNVLQADGLITADAVRRVKKAGRPRLVYTLTEKAHGLFPQNYDELARQLLTEMKAMMSEKEMEEMFLRIVERIAEDAPPPRPGQRFEERLAEVSEFLEQHGFITRLDQTDAGYLLRTINCPYREVMGEHGEVCDMDMALLKRLLDTSPLRLASIRDEDTSCTYLIAPVEESG